MEAPWRAAVGLLSGMVGVVVALVWGSPLAVLLAAGGVAVLVALVRAWKAG